MWTDAADELPAPGIHSGVSIQACGGSGGLWWHPGVAGQGVAEGVEWVNAVVAGGGQVGTHAAVAGGGAHAAPAAADFHLELDHALRLLGRVVGKRHGEVDGEAPDLPGAGL